MSKKPKPFNNPFQGLKLEPKSPSAPAKESSKAPKTAKQKPKVKPSPAAPVDDGLDVYDRKLFLDAVGGTEPLQNRERHVNPEAFKFEESSERTKLEDSMALDELRSLVGKDLQWICQRDDELVEGRIESVSNQVLRSLKRGEMEPLRTLDLHGMRVPEALRKLKSWVFEARADGVRCGLVVTGRGHHSEGGIAVLQREIPDALQEAPLSTHVLAFASATPKHGGPGALYVLLRKRDRQT